MGQDDCTYVRVTASGEAKPPQNNRRMIGPDKALASGAKFSCQIARKGNGHSGVVYDREHGKFAALRRAQASRAVVGEIHSIRKSSSSRICKPKRKSLSAGSLSFRRFSRSLTPKAKEALFPEGKHFAKQVHDRRRRQETVDVQDASVHDYLLGRNRGILGVLGSRRPVKDGMEHPCQTRVDDQPLVAALSFIHVEWWNYG